MIGEAIVGEMTVDVMIIEMKSGTIVVDIEMMTDEEIGTMIIVDGIAGKCERQQGIA